MSSLRETIALLEADLTATPMRHAVYHDMPYALFCYPPAEEWALRRELGLLRTRVEHVTGRRVAVISLAELLWQAIDESEGMDDLIALERREGFAAAERQVQNYLSEPDWRPLADLLAERLEPLDPKRHLAFIHRAGALAPNLYRVSRLLDELKGRTRVPSVLFMPATVIGGTVSYMGIADNEGRGSYHTKVYACEP